MTRDERGSATLLVILLLPLLITIVAGVVQLGALRVVASRVASAADLATLAAVDDQDDTELTTSGALRLSSDAVDVARRYFALNLAQIAGLLDITPDAAAAHAEVTVSSNSVGLAAAVPVRAPALSIFLLPPVTLVNVRSLSSPR